MMQEAKSPYKFAILIVDDDKMILEVFNKFFKQNNIEVYVADDTEQALRLTALYPHIKIILTDLYIPKSNIDGKTFARIVIEREPRTVVFAMTGHEDKFLLDDCLRIGFRDYFVKPINFSLLLHEVRCACNQIKRWESIK